MIQIIVLLEVDDRNLFKEYERHAFRIMRQYGGKLLSAFEPSVSESSGNSITELHILEFPSLQAFKNYREDSGLLSYSSLRQQAIKNTTIYVSEKFLTYVPEI
jgi:uncharacterized protein (DUF1330 family)